MAKKKTTAARKKTAPAKKKSTRRKPTAKAKRKPATAKGYIPKSEPGVQIDYAAIEKFDRDFDSNPAHKVALNAVTRGNMWDVALNRDVMNDSDMTFSHECDAGGPITDQARSGTCWLYAEINWLRILTKKKLKAKNFTYSHNFIVLWDKFEKANYYLEHMIEWREKSKDDRVLQKFFSDPTGDGGEWHFLVNLVKKYGLVPESVMPETWNRVSTRLMNMRVFEKLRQATAEIRRRAKKGATVAQLRKFKMEVMNEVYRILCICLGKPPKKFSWSYREKGKKKTYHAIRDVTPLQFARRYLPLKFEDTVSLMNSPASDTRMHQVYGVEYFQNIIGGYAHRNLNVPVDVIKKIAMKILMKKEPVLFGCEVVTDSHSREGILDSKVFDFDKLFNMDFKMKKGDELDYKNMVCTHAMLFTGVDVVRGKPRKWKVENSWGEPAGKKGWFIMSDEWFNNNILNIIVPKKYIPKKYLDMFKQRTKTLPFWHSFG